MQLTVNDYVLFYCVVNTSNYKLWIVMRYWNCKQVLFIYFCSTYHESKKKSIPCISLLMVPDLNEQQPLMETNIVRTQETHLGYHFLWAVVVQEVFQYEKKVMAHYYWLQQMAVIVVSHTTCYHSTSNIQFLAMCFSAKCLKTDL